MANTYNFGGKALKADAEDDSEEEKIKKAALYQVLNNRSGGGRSLDVAGGGGTQLFGRPQPGTQGETPASPAPAARPTMPEGDQVGKDPEAKDPKKYMSGTSHGMFVPSWNRLPAAAMPAPEDTTAVHLPGTATGLDPHDADRGVPSQQPGPPGQPMERPVGRQLRGRQGATLGSIRPR